MLYDSPMLLRLASTGAMLALVAGCGSNEPDLPPDLLDAIAANGSGGGNFPTGANVVRNFCFEGWNDPLAAGFDTDSFEQICFSDFYDPDGAKGINVLLVNTAAIWCTACKIEWGGSGSRKSLSEEATERESRGFRVLGLLFEDAENNRAEPEDVALWAETFDVEIPFAMDADFQMGLYADQTIQPFNMVLDAQTMEIVAEVNGDQPSVLFAEVDALLDKKAP